MYLTPERFKTMGLGVDLSDVEDVAIRSAISRASATIDAACSVPRIPQKHSFIGGVVTGERHDWVIDPYERPHANRVYLNHTPVVSVERIRIYSDNVNFVQIDVDQVVINNSGGYIEISSLLLTQYGVFGAGIVPYIGLFNPIIETDYTYRHEFAVVDDVAEPVDARTYQVQNQFWVPGADVEVKVDGTVVASSGYTVDGKEGWVIFGSNQPADSEVTVSYIYSLPWEISHACGLLTASDISEQDLVAKGMAGLASMSVQSGGGASVEIRRNATTGGGRASLAEGDLPTKVRTLLSGFIFVTAR